MDSQVVLVTGGAGFIGSHVVERLVHEGHEVLVLDDLSQGKMLPPKGVKLLKKDVTDQRAVQKVLRTYKPTTIFHLAAQKNVNYSVHHPVEDARVNIMGTLHLLDAAKEYGGVRVIFPSTAAVYPIQADVPIKEGTIPVPESPYGLSKRTAERYIQYLSSIHPIAGISLRLSNVYGPRQSEEGASVIAKFIKAIREGKQPIVFGSGEQTRDFIFVQDVVEAFLAAMRVDWCGEVNIATGREVSVNALLAHIQAILGTQAEPQYLSPKDGEVFRNALDPSLAGEVLGWEPKMTLEEGLRQTIEAMR